MKPPFPTAVPESAETGVERLGGKMEQRFGFHLPDGKKAGVWRAVLDTASERGLPPLECLRRLLDAPPGDDALEELALRLTVGETFFFRERKALDAFVDVILPDIATRKNDDIRLWSAGCSTGEEPYTLSMLAGDALPRRGAGSLSVLGSDINPNALEKARKGVYSRWSFRGMDESLILRYFSPCGAERYSVRDVFRKNVSFARLNLAERPWFLWRDGASPDAIFCRNVLIYFSQEKREEILEHFHEILPAGGWLVVASCETSPFLASRFSSIPCDGATLYRKEEAGRAASFPVASPLPQEFEPEGDDDAGRDFPFFPAATSLRRPPDEEAPGEPEDIPGGTFLSDDPEIPEPPGEDDSIQPSSDLRAIMDNVRNLANRGMHEAALREARDAHRRDGTDPVPLYFMSMLLQELGNEREAFSALRSAVFLDPEFILAHYAMGILALGAGKAGDAGRHLRNAEELLSRVPEDHVLPEGEGVTAGELLAAVRTLRGKTL